jgi:hypothetical protein
MVATVVLLKRAHIGRRRPTSQGDVFVEGIDAIVLRNGRNRHGLGKHT